jgi:hypothetical protein
VISAVNHQLEPQSQQQQQQQQLQLVFEGLVKSGFLAQNGLTETVTSPRPSQDQKNGLFRLINRLRRVKTRAGYN